jgi:esterase
MAVFRPDKKREGKMLGYAQFGKGPRKVIALHGWFGDQTTYDPMRDALSTDDFTYVFPAYRGYGLSKQIKGDYSIAEISADVLALADHLGWKTFGLIGHSMGGMAVQRVLADAPARVQKIVAVSPVPACGVPFPPEVDAAFAACANDIEGRRGIIDFSTGHRLPKTWTAHMAKYSAETAEADAFAGYYQAWSKTDFSDAIKGNPVSLKAIVGAHDPSLTADAMKGTYLAWYPNAALEVMENAGHYPMNETPIALAASIEAFLLM